MSRGYASQLLASAAILIGAGAAQGADPSLPPPGRSLFDFVVAGSPQVPFPFEALLARIGERLDGGADEGIRAVLIPLGRSLQRAAGGDAPFRFPRAVAAVVAEPRSSEEPLLKDRLYLGYHEKAEILEVISYNEAAGRFEFQVVRDYRAGARPRLAYANRQVCLSCHQNAAPIFSRPPWDETNANPGLQRLLGAENRNYYGIPIEMSGDAPNAIDVATDRANRFGIVQRLWREGCELPSGPAASIECRARAFTAALKYRLGGDRPSEREAYDTAGAFPAGLVESWGKRWPSGIEVPTPDLGNRDPLETLDEPARAAPDAAALRRAAKVAPEADPLQPRGPIDLRTGRRHEDIEYFVRHLAEFIAAPDVVALDRLLRERHARAGGGARAVRLPCQMIERAGRRRPTQLQFACISPEGARTFVSISGHFERRGDRVAGAAFDRWSPSVAVMRDIGVQPAAISRTERGEQVELEPEPQHKGVALRLENGDSVARVVLRWRARQPISAGRPMSGEADVWLRDDFAPAAAAIRALAEESGSGAGDAFSGRPFRRAAVIGGLFTELGAGLGVRCCIEAAGLPPPALD